MQNYSRNSALEKELSEIMLKYRVLTEEEVVYYLQRKLTHQPPSSVIPGIEQLVRSGLVFRSGMNLALGPKEKIERDIAIAFRVFAECFDTESRDIPADWPSSIIFTKKEDKHPCRITVCSDPEKDGNMSSLMNKRWDGHFHEIIVGINFSAKELSEKLIPNSKVTFAEYRAARPLIDTPQITYTRLRDGRDQTED